MRSRPDNKRILVYEPYWGGSHKHFLQDLENVLPFDFDFVTLPAHKWKWRMRLSAPWFAERFKDEQNLAGRYACLLCSTFVDVSALKGLCAGIIGDLPIVTYFHENQFAYPVQVDMERDFHFALTNVTTALCSDRLAFNSQYNLESFLAGCRELLKKSHDMNIGDTEKDIRAKSQILYPGIHFDQIDATTGENRPGQPPVVIWNHRWEHDKNPEEFFQSLYHLDDAGVPFSLVVLGESFRRSPAVFEEARTRLSKRIMQFGHVKSRREYYRWLRRGDLVVSTSKHEFYGIAVIEAVRAGCRPLLPARLSYPELFAREYLYEAGQLEAGLKKCLKKGALTAREAESLTEPFSWRNLSEEYRQLLAFR